MFVHVYSPFLLGQKEDNINNDTAKTKIQRIVLVKTNKELTVTRFTPDKCPPRHNPVDIAPQPEYKSSSLTSISLLS